MIEFLQVNEAANIRAGHKLNIKINNGKSSDALLLPRKLFPSTGGTMEFCSRSIANQA